MISEQTADGRRDGGRRRWISARKRWSDGRRRRQREKTRMNQSIDIESARHFDKLRVVFQQAGEDR